MINIPGVRVNWARLSRGFEVKFQHGPALNDVSSALVMFNAGCPPEKVAEIADTLAEHNGLAAVLRTVNMVAPDPKPAPYVPPTFHQR